MLSLFSIAIHWHHLESISLAVGSDLLASCHSSVECLQLLKLVEAVRSEDEKVVKHVKHRVVHERNLKNCVLEKIAK